MEAPALAIMIPLLIRGLRERATAVKRKAALIIDNMAKVRGIALVMLMKNPPKPPQWKGKGKKGIDKTRGVCALVIDNMAKVQVSGACPGSS